MSSWRVPTYTHQFDGILSNKPAHRITVKRLNSSVDFVSRDGRDWEPQMHGQVITSKALMFALGMKKQADLEQLFNEFSRIVQEKGEIQGGSCKVKSV